MVTNHYVEIERQQTNATSQNGDLVGSQGVQKLEGHTP